MKRIPMEFWVAIMLASLFFWTGCSTPEGGTGIALRLFEPAWEETGVDLEPTFSWEVHFHGMAPRDDFAYTLHVAPLGEAYGAGVSTRQTTACWPEPLEAGVAFRWMVELSRQGYATVCSDEGRFSTREYYVVQVQVEQGSNGQIRVNEGPWGESFTLEAPVQQELLLEARSQPDFVFEGWYAGETFLGSENPLAYMPGYAATTRNDGSDLQVQARFAPKRVELTLQASPSQHGLVCIGEGEWAPRASLELQRGQQAVLHAQPLEGFCFEGWFLENGADSRARFLGEQNPMPYEPVDSCVVLASFVPNTYAITVESSPSVGGNVRINGGAWGNFRSEEFQVGDQVEVRALAASGYHFAGWFEDGQRVSEDASLDWTVQGQRSLVASFCRNPDPPLYAPLEQKWVFSIGAAFSSSPAVGSDGTIYLGADDTYLYAVNPGGTQKWAFPTGGPVKSSPTVASDGTIYVTAVDARIVTTPTVLFSISPDGVGSDKLHIGDTISNSPVFRSVGTLSLCSEKGFVLTLTGTELTWGWAYFVGDVQGNHVANSQYLLVPDDDHKLHAIDLVSGGAPKWSFVGDSVMRGSPAIAQDGTVFVGTTSQLYALDPEKEPTSLGEEEWKYPGEGQNIDFSRSQPSIAPDGTIYAPANDGVYALSPLGSLKWHFGSSQINTAPLVGNDGTVYVAFQSGMLYALNPEDGSEKWCVDLGSPVSASPAMGSDGTLYVATEGGDLFAFTSYGTGLAESSWPKFQGDPRNTGSKE